ncbi:MAG: retron system putative HNH endonuclease [Myxococcota bacterium]
MKKAESDFLAELGGAGDPSAFARSSFDGLEKPKLRTVLYAEQGHVCVYCERRVEEGYPAPRIDHWRPLSQNPSLALHWRNLYLSCPTEATCDCRKHESPLCDREGDPELPWPVSHPYERCVGFTSLGEMYVREDAPLDDDQRRALVKAIGQPHTDTIKDNGILNLNHPALVAARAAAVDSERSRLERDFSGKTASREDREDRAANLFGAGKLSEYVSIRTGWLRRTLGKSR